MADVDEDAIRLSALASAEDNDLDDETQDFRFLSSLSLYISLVPPHYRRTP